VSLNLSGDKYDCLVAGPYIWFSEQAFRPLFRDVQLSTKEGEMLKLFFLLALTILVIMQTQPGFCEGARVIMLQVSATMPPHVMINANHQVNPFSDTVLQITQTQLIIRDNRTISLTSIVVP